MVLITNLFLNSLPGAQVYNSHLSVIRFSWLFSQIYLLQEVSPRNSLAIQGLEPSALNARVLGLIPVLRTKIPQAMWCSQKKEGKEEIAPRVL